MRSSRTMAGGHARGGGAGARAQRVVEERACEEEWRRDEEEGVVCDRGDARRLSQPLEVTLAVARGRARSGQAGPV